MCACVYVWIGEEVDRCVRVYAWIGEMDRCVCVCMCG